MRALVCLMVSVLMLPMSVQAARKAAVPIEKSRANMQANLLKRCNNGVAAACYNYGKALIADKKNRDIPRGKLYIRRACTLAYAPACDQPSSSVSSKVVKDTKAKVDAKGQPCNATALARAAKLSKDGRQIAHVNKGSLWDQSGIQAGDTILSVNGEPFTSTDQIGNTLNNGGAVINLMRNGSETSVMVNCP